MKSLRNEGFTLVEMLVVIAIIAILAGALFPAITGAMESARATAMKNKGRATWVAISAANSDREVLGEFLLWPKDVKAEESSINSTESYLTYLMSDNVTLTKIADKQGDQIVGDLKRDSFAGAGVVAKNTSTKIEDANNAWSVLVIGENDDAMDALFITRNADLEGSLNRPDTPDSGSSGSGGPKVPLRDVKPFGGSRAVWVTRGGGILDARAIYLFTGRLLAPPVENADADAKKVDTWANTGGGS